MDFAVISHLPGRARHELTTTETWGRLQLSLLAENRIRVAQLLPMGAQVGVSLLPPLQRVQLAEISGDFLVLVGRESHPDTGPVRFWSCRRPCTLERQMVLNRKSENTNVEAAHLHWWNEMVQEPDRRHIPISEIRERFGFSHDVLWRFIDWIVADHRGHLEGNSNHPELGVLYVHSPDVRESYVYVERSWER